MLPGDHHDRVHPRVNRNLGIEAEFRRGRAALVRLVVDFVPAGRNVEIAYPLVVDGLALDPEDVIARDVAVEPDELDFGRSMACDPSKHGLLTLGGGRCGGRRYPAGTSVTQINASERSLRRGAQHESRLVHDGDHRRVLPRPFANFRAGPKPHAALLR